MAEWRHAWLWLNAAASFGAPFLWGVALSALLHGVPLNSSDDFSGSVGDILSAYTVFAGIAFVLLCACHGSRVPRAEDAGRPARARARRRAAPVPAGGDRRGAVRGLDGRTSRPT